MNSNSDLVNKPYCSSLIWANDCLRAGILELKNEDRSLPARLKEVRTYIRLLDEANFWWQRNILRYHLHLFFQGLQPKADTSSEEEGSS